MSEIDSERAKLASMRAMTQRPSPAPWIAAALLTALAFAVGRFTHWEATASSPPPLPPPAPPPALPEPDPTELRALQTCIVELGGLQKRVDDECPALAGAMAPAAAAPGASPGKTAPTDGGVADATEAAAKADAARRAAFRREFMARVVGVKGPAGEWLADYVCLVDELRDRTVREIASTMDDPAAYPDEVDEIVSEAKQEREAMLGDIEARLGPARYAKLRDIGGLAILSLACVPDRTDAVSRPPDAAVANAP